MTGAGKTIGRLIGYGFGIALLIFGLLCLAGGVALWVEEHSAAGC